MTATALVVEDDDRDMAAIEDTLCSMQHEFERTTNQSDALRFLGKRTFDYAILDLRIPARPDRKSADVEFGGNLLRDLRRRWSEQQLPVIVMADDVECFGMAKWLIEKGASDFVSKPFRSTHELGDVIRRVLKRSDRPQHSRMRRPQSRDFAGGELVITANEATLQGVRIISSGGIGHSLMILRLLSQRDRQGKFVTRSAEELADEMDVLGGQTAIAGYVRTIRENIKSRLHRELGVRCHRDDVIERTPSGYRLRDWIRVSIEEETLLIASPVECHVRTSSRSFGVPLNSRQTWVVEQLLEGCPLQRRQIEVVFQVHSKTAKRDLAELVRHGLIEYVRSGQGGYYRLTRALKSA
ncbi:MAG: response regulator transcription factor [Planctomycetaceae bacterium]|nr:response regulator transcription factor [Planctomycetaceae bacterium]